VTVPVVRFTVSGEEAHTHGADALAIGVGEDRPYVVIYDGNCRVCGRIVRTLQKWDRRGVLEIVPSQRAGVRQRYPWLTPQAFAESVQLIGPGGVTFQGAAAVERLLDLLPKGGLITWLFSIPFVRPLAEKFYRWFARNRYKLGCGEHCTAQLKAESGKRKAESGKADPSLRSG
jgi:predicted DCC family thiol-disulfide oxidoreductase YuxK